MLESKPRTLGKFNLNAINKHFPKENFRDGQKEAIEFALKSFNDGKKVVILECPTGGGKSAVGMTIADMVNTSYYLTITKILQDQLVRDFDDQVVELRGRASYPCTFWDKSGQKLVDKKLISSKDLFEKRQKFSDCANGFCKTKINSNKNKFKCLSCFTPNGPVKNGIAQRLSPGNHYSDCPYYEQVHQAINGRKVVMNFSSFLFQTQMTKRFDEPRDLMVIDEAHNVEPQLLSFVSLSISDFLLQDKNIYIPKLDNPVQYANFFKEINFPNVILEIINEAEKKENTRLVDELSRLLKKYKTFIDQVALRDDSPEWVSEYEIKKSGSKEYRTVTLKPVFATDFVQPLLFKYAGKILMMSATILDVNVVCRSLGLDKSHIAAYRMKNRFPVEKRPIYLNTVGKMTGGKARMHEWAPKMVSEIEKITSKYPNDKGIIHTHNFAIMDYILKSANFNVKNRLLNQRDFNNKLDLLDKHAKSKNSIIIAPAMHEGIDLKDDLSRFQVICKVPYPNCFDDLQLARRVEVDRKYYMWLTALKIVQAYGRSVRSEDDYADTYILDESIHKFLDDTRNMIPTWFTEAIVK